MRHHRGRAQAIGLLSSTLLVLDPLLRVTPAAAATQLSGPEVHNSGMGGAGPSVNVNANSGDATYAMPISLPPGTAGMTPNLALTYNSNQRTGSFAGVGWSVPTSSIRRSLRRGTPEYDDSLDEFEFDGQRLVYQSTQGSEKLYRTEHESFIDVRWNTSSNAWTATRKDGHRLSFGLTAQAKITTTDGVFEWLLEKESNPLGNSIDYSYHQEAGTAYLQEVQYGASPRRVVRLELEPTSTPRPDTPVSHLAGFPQTLTRRLDFIRVQTVGGANPTAAQIIRRFDLEYSDASGGQSVDSGRSLLRAVALYGVGGTGTPLRTKFTYRQSTAGTTTGWGAWQAWTVTGGTFAFNATTRIADINGDGLQDVVSFGGADPNRKIFLSTGTGFTTTHDYPLPFYSDGTQVNFLATSDSQMADFNGDGRADFLLRGLASTYTAFTFADKANWLRSTAGGWGNVPGITIATDLHLAVSGSPVTARMADLNGDGAPEILVRGDFRRTNPTQTTCSEGRRSDYYYENAGDMTFSLAPLTTNPDEPAECPPAARASRLSPTYQVDGSYTPPLTKFVISNVFPGTVLKNEPSHLQLVDLNNDGLADVAWTKFTAPSTLERRAYLNNGNGAFVLDDDWRPPVDLQNSSNQSRGVVLVDVNGDGIVDVIRAQAGSARQTWLGDGDGDGPAESAWTVPSAAWALPEDLFASTGFETNIRLIDVNGDGMVDLANGTQVRLNRGAIPDLLLSVELPYGAKTTIAWKTSSSAIDTALSVFPNSNASDVGFMPMVKPVVGALEHDDRKGNIGRRAYSYAEGVFDPAAREFRGFKRVLELGGVSDGAGGFTVQDHQTITSFHTDPVRGGLVASQSLYDMDGVYIPWTCDQFLGCWGDFWIWTPYERRTTVFNYGTGAAGARDERLPVCIVEKQSEAGSPIPGRRIGTQIEYGTDANMNPPGNGNATKITQLGLVTNDSCADDSSDGIRLTLVDYATDTTGRVRDRPSRVKLFGALPPAGQLRDTKINYDYSSTNGSISNGLITEVQRINLVVPGSDAITKFVYDAAGRLTSTINPRENAGETGIGTGGGTRLLAYGAAGLPDLVSQTQSEPYWTQGGVYRLTMAVSYSSDTSCAVAIPAAVGLPAIITDPNGAQTVVCYDGFGRLVSRVVKDPAGSEVARVTFAYSDTPASQTTSPTITITEMLNATQSRSETQSLDGFGRTILSSFSGPGTMTIQRSVSYDVLGRVAAMSLPGSGAPGALTTFSYDGLGREVSRTVPGATAATTRYVIDGTKLRTDMLAPDSNGTYSPASETRYLSDAFGNTVEVREMSGSATTPSLYASTTYLYDGADLLKEIRDHHGNKTLFGYDGLGRRISMTDPDTGVWIWTHDRNGNVIFQDGPRTTDTLSFAYDRLDRMTVITRESLNPKTSKTFFYDYAVNGLGRFWKERDANEGFGVVAYDALGRPITVQAVAAGKQLDFQTTYNRAGDVLTRTYPTGRVVTYGRDTRGFVTGVTTGADIYASSVSWHHSLRVASWTAGNGVVTTSGYHATTQLPSSFTVPGVESITAYEYHPDLRLKQTKNGSTVTSSFNYDDLGRLVNAFGPYNAGYANTTLYYGYDPIGNLTCLNASAAPSGTTCTNGKLFTYAAANPTNPPPRPHAPTAISGMPAPAYDEAGNMTSGNGRGYQYDPHGQLAKVTQGATTLDAEYASDGKVWKVSAGGVTRYRISDDFEWNQTLGVGRTSVFLDGQIIAITEESFTPPTYGGCGNVWPSRLPHPAGGDIALALAYALSGALALPLLRAIRRRRPRSTRAWVAVGTSGVFLVFVSVPPGLVPEPAAAAAPANTTFFHADRLGSSLVVSNNTGTASAKRVVYRPFGELVQNPGGTSTVPERGFTGQRFEPSIGIYDYNARWYDPAIARFMQPDALARAFDPQSLNPFAYVRNDPTNRTDPTGNLDGNGFGAPIGHSGWCPHFNFPDFTFTPGWAPTPSGCGLLGCVTPPNLTRMAIDLIFKKITGMALPPVDLIASVLRDPIGAMKGLLAAILNPRFDVTTVLTLSESGFEDIISITGTNKDTIIKILDILFTKHDVGKETLDRLRARGKRVTIIGNDEGKTWKANYLDPTGNTIEFDPTNPGVMTEVGTNQRVPSDPVATMSHELGHVLEPGAPHSEIIRKYENPVLSDRGRRQRQNMKGAD